MGYEIKMPGFRIPHFSLKLPKRFSKFWVVLVFRRSIVSLSSKRICPACKSSNIHISNHYAKVKHYTCDIHGDFIGTKCFGVRFAKIKFHSERRFLDCP